MATGLIPSLVPQGAHPSRALTSRSPLSRYLSAALLLLSGLLCAPTLVATPIAGQRGFERQDLQLTYQFTPPAWALSDPTQSTAVTSASSDASTPRPQTLHLPLWKTTTVGPYHPWAPRSAQQRLLTTLIQQAGQQWPGVRFYVTPNTDSVRFVASDPAQQPDVAKWLLDTRQQLLQSLLQQSYLQRGQDAWGNAGILPDYARIIEETSSEIGDTAEAMLQAAGGEQTPPRQRMAWLLAFVQSIPWAALSSDDGSRGSGFLLPREVLAQNRGDCDSKVTLLAALWRYLQPEIPTRIVLMPGHAALAVGLPAAPGEETVTDNNVAWLLLEPTGPALMAPGHLGDHSRLYIHSGRYRLLPTQPTETNSTPSK